MPILFLLFFISSCVYKVIPPEPPLENDFDEHSSYEVGLILIGDTGTGENGQYEVATAMEIYCSKNLCDAALLLGDNIYPKGIKDENDQQMIDKFERPYKNITFPFYPVIGNHDDRGSWEAQVRYKSDKWIMPSRWYELLGDSFDIFAIDTSYSAFQNPFHTKQRKWLKKELSLSKAPWKIVYGHYPVFSYGFHGNDFELKHYLKPMLEEYGVDFYISGHDHNKELFEKEGVNYIVSGTGAKTSDFTKKCGCDFISSTLGFAHLLLNKKEAVLRFVNVDGRVEYEKKYSK